MYELGSAHSFWRNGLETCSVSSNSKSLMIMHAAVETAHVRRKRSKFMKQSVNTILDFIKKNKWVRVGLVLVLAVILVAGVLLFQSRTQTYNLYRQRFEPRSMLIEH